MNIASKRLMRDYLEIKKSNDIKIFASPLENNLFEWHANICPTEGIYTGIILHFILKFTNDYPKEPPKIKLMTGIPHSNIIKHQNNDYYLCMDLINNCFWMDNGGGNEPYRGWSSSYTVKTILMQLQTFLFEEFIENYDGRIKHTLYELSPEEGGGYRDKSEIKEKIDKAFKDSYNFKCNVCGHCFSNPKPEICITIPDRKEFILRRDLIVDNNVIPELITVFNKIGYKDFLENLIKQEFSYSVSIDNCNCMGCVFLREKHTILNSVKDKDISEFFKKIIPLKIFKNLDIKIWKYLKLKGYDDNLNYKYSNNNYKNYIQTNNKTKSINLDHLNLNILRMIFNNLNSDTLIILGQKLPEIKKYTSLPEFTIKRELNCFFTKESFMNEILGYGINIKYFKKSDQIQSINIVLDLVSKEAYDNNCNYSVWNEEFRFWFPLKINNNHVERARKIIEQTVANIYFSKREGGNINDRWPTPSGYYDLTEETFSNGEFKINYFKPKYMVDIMCKILSSMIVDMMKDNLHASIKALNGFCEFHYLLIQFIEWYPEIKTIADEKIDFFINNFRYVNKLKYNSLGEFIILLLITKKYKWDDIKYNFMKESECRNIRWILKEYPDFEDIYNHRNKSECNNEFVDSIFDIVKVGKKLNLFTIYFINEIALENQKNYKEYYGRPTPEIEIKFQIKVKQIKSIEAWEQYYKELNLYMPPRRKILSDYINSINISKMKKYHKVFKKNDILDKSKWS